MATTTQYSHGRDESETLKRRGEANMSPPSVLCQKGKEAYPSASPQRSPRLGNDRRPRWSAQSELELEELLAAAAGAGVGVVAGVLLVDSPLVEVDGAELDAPFDDGLDEPRLSFL